MDVKNQTHSVVRDLTFLNGWTKRESKIFFLKKEIKIFYNIENQI